MMNSDGAPLTVPILQANAEMVRTAYDKRWTLWVFQDIMLWKMVGVWPAPVARAHFTEIWQAFLALREKHDPVFLLIDTDHFAQQSYQFRDMLVKEWSHVLDRGDLVICLVATDPMRRAVRNTMAMLAGRLEQFRFYKSFEAALRFIEGRKRDLGTSTGTSLRTIGDVVDELARAHERLAQQHEQDVLESEIVGDLERRFQQMFREFPAPVYYFDLWGRFAWINRKAEEVFGCRLQDLVGVPYFESRLAAFEDLVRVARLLAAPSPGPRSWPVEFSAVRQDGSRARLEVVAQLTSFGPKKVILCIASAPANRRAFGGISGGTSEEAPGEARGTPDGISEGIPGEAPRGTSEGSPDGTAGEAREDTTKGIPGEAPSQPPG